jgi:hypothetical protein
MIEKEEMQVASRIMNAAKLNCFDGSIQYKVSICEPPHLTSPSSDEVLHDRRIRSVLRVLLRYLIQCCTLMLLITILFAGYIGRQFILTGYGSSGWLMLHMLNIFYAEDREM